MRKLHALVGAALVALTVPVVGGAQQAQQTQAPPLKITQSPSDAFPDRAYLLQLPNSRALVAKQVEVTENGNPVTALGVTPPGG